LARKVLLGVGFKFDASDIDTRAIQNVISKALADIRVKLSKADLAESAKADLGKSLDKVGKAQPLKPAIDKGALARVKTELEKAFTIPSLQRVGGAQFQTFVKQFSRDLGISSQQVNVLADATTRLTGSLRVAEGIKLRGFDARAIAQAKRQVEEFGAAVRGSSEKTKRKQIKDIADVEKFRRAALEQAKRSRRQFDATARATPGGGLRAAREELQRIQDPTVRQESSIRNLIALYKAGGVSAEFFGAQIARVTARFAAYLISLRAIFAVQRAFNQSLDVIFKFDAAIQDLNKVLNDTPQRLAAASAGIFEVARATGQGFQAVTDSLQIFVRQGLGSTEAALERTKAALIAVNISELSVIESTKLITTALRIFKDDVSGAENALDILSVTADNAATSAGEVGKGILRAGAAAKEVGISFQELNALLAATIEQTQLVGSRVGSAFKTIFSRIVTNTQAIREQINSFGGYVEAGDSVFTILRKLADVFPTLNKEQKGQLAFLIAGRRRFTELAGLLQSFTKAEELLAKQLDSAGVAAAKNERELDKLSTRARLVAVNFSELIATLAGVESGAEGVGVLRSAFGSILDFIAETAGGVTTLVKSIKEAGAAGELFSNALTAIGKGVIFTVGAVIIRKIVTGFRQFAQIGRIISGLLTEAGLKQGNIDTKIKAGNIRSRLRIRLLNNIIRISRRMVGIKTEEERSQKRILTAEKERLAVAQNRARTEARTTQRAGAFTQDLFARGGAASLAVSAGVLIGLEQLSSSLNKIAADFDEVGNSVAESRAQTLRNLSSSAQLGVAFGLLAGPVVGSLVAAVSFAAKEIFTRFRSDRATRQLTQSFDKIANRTVSLELIQREFGDAALESAKKMVKFQDGVDKLSESPIQLGRFLTERRQELAESLGGIPDIINKVNRLIDATAEEARFAIAEAGFGKELAKFRDDLLSQKIKLELETDFGRGGEAVRGIVESFARARASTQFVADSLVGIQSSFEGITRAAELFSATAGKSGQSLVNILKLNNAITPELETQIGLLERRRQINDQQIAQFEKQVSEVEALNTADKDIIAGLTKQVEESRKGEASRVAIASLEKNIAARQRVLAEREGELKNLTQARNTLLSEQVKLQTSVDQVSKGVVDTFKKANISLKQIIEGSEQVAITFANATNQIEAQSEFLRLQAAEAERLAELRLAANTQEKRDQLELQRIESERVLREERALGQARRDLEILRAIRAAAATDPLFRPEDFDVLDRNVRQAELKLAELSKAFEAQIALELQPRITAVNTKLVEEREKRLSEVRVNLINIVGDAEEQRLSDTVNLIQQIGQSARGLEVIERVFGRVSTVAERTFGRLGAQIVRSVERQGIARIQRLFAELGATPGTDTASRRQKQLEIDRERATIRQQLLEAQREQIIAQVNRSIQKVNEAEQELVAARNQVPPSTEKVIQASRELATAQASVVDETKNLFSAYQAAADATSQFQFSVAKARADIIRATGRGGIAGAFTALRSALSAATRGVKASADQIRQIRAQLAQEEISILQSTFSTIEGFALSAATATAEQLNEQRAAIDAAQRIVRTGATAGIDPDTLQAIGSSVEALETFAPGLREALREIGAEKLGIDPTTFGGLEAQMIQLSEVSQQAGESQVEAAGRQAKIAQEQLIQVKENVDAAKQQLNLAREQKQILIDNVASARSNVATVRQGFARNSFFFTQQLRELQNLNVTSQEQRDLFKRLVDEGIRANLADPLPGATAPQAAEETAKKVEDERRPEGLDSADKANEAIAELRSIAESQLVTSPEDVVRNNLIEDLVSKGADQLALQGKSVEEIVELKRRFESIDTTSQEQKNLNQLIVENTDTANDILNEEINVLRSGFDTLNQSVTSLVDSFNRAFANAQSVSIEGSARGSLNSAEINGLVRAAQQEKRLMPAGSKLMLANTSEVVLTNKQARLLGMRPAPKAFAQEGNADVTNLQQTAAALTTAVNAILTRLNEPGFVQQDISVNIDSERRVSVNAGDIDAAIRQTFEDQSGQFALKAEQDAIADTVTSLISRLNEFGIVDVQGA
jgi:TP901 family phage tail tape measure protein